MPSNITHSVFEPYKILGQLNARQRRTIFMYGGMGHCLAFRTIPESLRQWFDPQGDHFQEKPSKNTIKVLLRHGLLEKRSWVRVRFTDLGRDVYRILFWETFRRMHPWDCGGKP